MEFQGIVHLQDLDRKVLEFDASHKNGWVQDFIRDSAPEHLPDLSLQEWVQGVVLRVQGRLEKVGSDYLLRAELEGRVPSPCSRCGDAFMADRRVSVQTVFHREDRGGSDSSGSDLGDADYVPVLGPSLDLGEVFREQLVFLEPVAECPPRNRDGSCELCHKNPQFGAQISGQARAHQANSPFSKLSSVDLSSPSQDQPDPLNPKDLKGHSKGSSRKKS